MELRPLHQKESTIAKKIAPIIIGLFIIAVMVLSVLEIGNNNNEETIKYNDHKFTKINDRWVTYIDKSRIALLYNPKELEGINADVNYNSLLLSNKIYLSINYEDQGLFIPANEIIINKNLLGLTNQMIAACSYDNSVCKEKNLPFKTCNDTSSSTGVIVLETGNETAILFSSNCLTLKGQQEDLNKIITKLVLKRLGIS